MEKFTSNSRLFHDTEEEKRHYKLYKKGKLWLTAGTSLLFAGMILTTKQTVAAAETTDAQSQATTTDTTAGDTNKVVLQSSKTTTDKTSADDTKVTAFSGIAATIQVKSKTQDNTATTDPTVYAVTLADGLKQPTWTTGDFDQSGITSQAAGVYSVTLTEAGIAKLQAANPTYTFTAANVKAGQFTITAATTTATTVEADETGAAVADSDDETTTDDKSTDESAKATTDTQVASEADTETETADSDTAAETIDTTTTAQTYDAATAASIAQGAQKTADTMTQYMQQDQDLADSDASDNVVNNDAMKALQQHVTSEKNQVLDLTSAAEDVAPTNESTAVQDLAQAAQILNNMNLELTQAVTMLKDDRQGASTNAEAIAQAALDQLTLPAGTSGKTDAYGDLIITAPDQASFQAAVDAVKAQGLLKDFRQVVDPDTEGLDAQAGTTDLTATVIFNAAGTAIRRPKNPGTYTNAGTLIAKAQVNTGDVIKVTFAAGFNTLKSDNVMGVTQVKNADGSTTFTFTADQTGDQSINFDWTSLSVSDDQMKAGTTLVLPVTMTIGNKTIATQNYTVTITQLHDTLETKTQDLTITPNLTLDDNQTTVLKVGEEYAFGAAVTPDKGGYSNTASAITGTIDVPDGFVLDGAMPLSGYAEGQANYSENDGSVGDRLGTTNRVPNTMGTSATQAGGAGTTISFNSNTTSMSGGASSGVQTAFLYFWGHYTKPVAAADNVMTVKVDDTSVKSSVTEKNANETTDTVQTTSAVTGTDTTQAFKIAVTDNDADNRPENQTTVTVNAQNTSDYLYGDEFIKQSVEADGSLISDDDSYYPSNEDSATDDTVQVLRAWQGAYLNSGNVAETNVNFTIDAPGAINGRVIIRQHGTLNLPDTLTFTAADGSTYTADGSSGAFDLPADKTYDKVVAHYDTILPGAGVSLDFLNFYLDTDLPAGSDYTITSTVTSDQVPDPVTGKDTVKVVDPISKPYAVNVGTVSAANIDGNVRQGDTVAEDVRLEPTITGRPLGVYYYVVPTGTTVDLVATKLYTKSISQYATDLGAVGPDGRDVLKLDFSSVLGLSDSTDILFKMTVNSDALPGAVHSSNNFIQENQPYFSAYNPDKKQDVVGDLSINESRVGGTLNFNVLVDSFFGAKNGIDAPQTVFDHTYLQYDEKQGATLDNPTIAVFSRGSTTSTDDDLNATMLRLTSINTQTVSPSWTQNVVTLPSVDDGDAFTLQLTGAGTLSTTSPAGSALLYSTATFDTTKGKLDDTQFMTADEVTAAGIDWTTIRTVMIQTGSLPQGSTAVATLPVAVANINSVPDSTIVTFNADFLGVDIDGANTYNSGTMAAAVEETQILTTQWLKQNDDGTTTPIVPTTTGNYHIGDAYTTSALADTEVPAHYKLVATPDNATGTMGEDPITVTYLYEYVPQKAVVQYVDDDADGAVVLTDDSTAVPGLTGAAGTRFDYGNAYTQDITGLTAKGYVVVASKAADALPSNNIVIFDSDDATDQTYTVHLKHNITTAEVSRTITQTIQYVYAEGGKVQADHVDAVTFTATSTTDDVVAAEIANAKATITDPDQLAAALAKLGDATTVGKWTAKKGSSTYTMPFSFVKVTDPSVAGYTNDHPADQQYVDQMTVDPDVNGDANILLTVTYTADAQKALVNYVDDDAKGAVVYTDTVSGVSNGTSDYLTNYNTETNKLKVAGYVIGDDDFGDDKFSDDTTKVITFDTVKDAATGNPTQVYTVHLTHDTTPATDPADLTDIVNETINYTYDSATGEQAHTPNTAQVTFTRTGTIDLVKQAAGKAAGETDADTWTTWSDWAPATAEFAPVVSPTIDGYTADTATVTAKTVKAEADDLVIPVIYTANVQKAIVNYVDDDNGGATVYTDNSATTAGLAGKSNASFNYTSGYTTETGKLTGAGYIVGKDNLPSDKTIVFDADDATDQTFTVHLTHNTVPATADLTDSVKETITYVYAKDNKTAAPTVTKTIDFTRTGTVDQVTKQTTYTNWVADNGDDSDGNKTDDTFVKVDSPEVKGYTPDQTQVNAKTVAAGDDDYAVVVKYSAETQKGSVTYVDDDADQAVLKTDKIAGDSATTYDYNDAYDTATAAFEKAGYTIGKSDLPAGNVVTFDTDTTKDQTYTVHLSHNTTPVTKDTDLNQTVTSTIHYVFEDGTKAAEAHQEVLTFTRTGVTDNVTGVTTYTPWTTTDDTFDQVANPVIAGYFTTTYGVGAVGEVQATADDLDTTKVYRAFGNWVPNLPEVPAQQYPGNPNDPTQPEDPADPNYPTIPYVPGYTPHDPDGNPLTPVDPNTPSKGYIPPVLPEDPGSDTPIIYTADNQKASVTYIDDTTKQQLNQVSLDGDTGATSDYRTTAAISDYEGQGYTLVSNDYPAGGVVFDDDDTVDQAFTVHLKHTLVPVTDNTQLQAAVTSTIHYVYAKDGTIAAADNVQTLNFKRTGTTDKVTGKSTFTAWTTDDDDFDQVTNPTIAGYSTATKGVGAVLDVTADDADLETTVTYNADVQQGTVTYIDDNAKSTLTQDALSGKSNTRSDYRTTATIDAYTAKGYTVVSDNYPASGVIFDTDTAVSQDFEVHLAHVIVPVTDPAALNQTVTSTIHYVYAKDGTTAAKDSIQTLNFTRAGVTDRVTNKTTYSAWTTDDDDFDAVLNPVIAGYSTATQGVGAVLNVDGDADDLETTITYNADVQKGQVTYIDDTTHKTLDVEALSGKSNERSAYRTTAAIAGYTLQGYALVSDNYPTNGVQFDTDDSVDQKFEVHLVEKTDTYTPGNPGTPGEPTDPEIPDGPKTPEGSDKASLDQVVTEVVHYVYENGTTAFDDHTDQVEFTRTLTFNEVTGAKDYTDWVAKQADTTFDQVESPALKGYLADKASVAEVDGLTETSDNVEETVTYSPLGSWVPNLPQVPDTQYPNDPGDPSQPEDPTDPNYPTIPYVPGYTPHDPSGNPLVPVDPGTPEKGYIPPVLPGDPGDDTPITYTADGQKAIVNYVDDDNAGAIVKTDTVTGDSDTTNDYSGVKAANDGGFIALGYIVGGDDLPKGSVITFDTDDSTDQTYTVHLTHKHVPATPDKPGTPGDPIDPNGDPKWPAGSDKISLSKTVTETVHYVYTDGTTADDDKTDKVEFTRTADIDEVTGEITYTQWQATGDDTTFDQKNSKVIAGYVADKASVAEVDGLTETSDNVEETVTYSPLGSWVPNLPQVPDTQYPNDPGDPSQPEDPTDPNYPTIPYVPGYTPHDPSGNPLVPVDPGTPEKGYIPPVLPGDPGDDTPITYTADDQLLNVVYLDTTTHQWLATDHDNGESDTKSTYTTAAKIAAYVAGGYALVNDGFPSAGVIFDRDDTKAQTYVVTLAHLTVPATPDNPGTPGEPIDPENPDGPKWPNGTDKASLTKTVNEVVHYVYTDGTKAAADHTDHVTFARTATVDEITGAVTYTDWNATDDDDSFDSIDSPVISGYLADKANVAEVDGLTQASEDVEETVTYAKLGNWVPNLPNVPETTYPNDPEDPSQPGNPSNPDYPSIPYVPGYTPYGPDGDPLTPVDPDNPEAGYIPPVLPDDPSTDTPITYVPDTDEPATPAHPQLPDTGNDTPSTPATPATPQTTDTPAQKAKVPAAEQPQAAQLPTTGDQSQNWLAMVGLSIVATLGLVGAKRRREDDK